MLWLLVHSMITAIPLLFYSTFSISRGDYWPLFITGTIYSFLLKSSILKLIMQTLLVFTLPTNLYDYCVKSLDSFHFYTQHMWLLWSQTVSCAHISSHLCSSVLTFNCCFLYLLQGHPPPHLISDLQHLWQCSVCCCHQQSPLSPCYHLADFWNTGVHPYFGKSLQNVFWPLWLLLRLRPPLGH